MVSSEKLLRLMVALIFMGIRKTETELYVVLSDFKEVGTSWGRSQ